jgi:hypothetical protein
VTYSRTTPKIIDTEKSFLTEELIPLLGEIRDHLKRIADVLEAAQKGEFILSVETGLETVGLRQTDLRKITDAIRGYVDK